MKHNPHLLEAMAKRLSEEGWRFGKEVSPEGLISYRGHGPRMQRIRSSPDFDEREALSNAIIHAATFADVGGRR